MLRVNTNETALPVDDRRPPSPTACGTRGQVLSESLPSTARNNTVGAQEEAYKLKGRSRPLHLRLTHLKTSYVGAEIGRVFAAAQLPLALVAHLVVQHVGLHLHPLINVHMLQLHEPGGDRRYVALLVRERHAAGAFRILELGIRVNASVAHATVQPVHDHRQFSWKGEKWRI